MYKVDKVNAGWQRDNSTAVMAPLRPHNEHEVARRREMNRRNYGRGDEGRMAHLAAMQAAIRARR